jgi:hypothetical protein
VDDPAIYLENVPRFNDAVQARDTVFRDTIPAKNID